MIVHYGSQLADSVYIAILHNTAETYSPSPYPRPDSAPPANMFLIPILFRYIATYSSTLFRTQMLSIVSAASLSQPSLAYKSDSNPKQIYLSGHLYAFI